MLPGASAARRAAIHALGLRIVPAPKSVADSREILRVLQSFGAVTTYRWLKHDSLSSAPNQALAIYQDEMAMNALLRACPLTFEVNHSMTSENSPGEVQDEQPDEEVEFGVGPSSTAQGIPESLAGDELNRTSNSLSSYSPHTPTTTGELQRRKPSLENRPQLYRVQADLWRGKHKDWLERHPFWGPFKVQKKGVVPQDLGKRVPLQGLSDINLKDKPEIPIRVLLRRADELANKASLREMIQRLRSGDGQSTSGHMT